MSSVQSYPWVRRIEELLVHLNEKPQFGGPEFPWEALENSLQTLFRHPELKLEHQMRGWESAEKCLEDFTADTSLTPIFFSPLEAPVYFMMGDQESKRLMSALLGGEGSASPFYAEEYAQGFQQFLLLEVLSQISGFSFFESLMPRLGERHKEKSYLANHPCFVISVSLSMADQTFVGKLLIPEKFRAAWKLFLINKPRPPFDEEQAEKIPVQLGLEVGETLMSLQEWKKTKAGDFLILDRCTWDPETKSGRVILTLENRPVFRGKLTEYGIKLFEYPLYEEVEAPMREEDEFEEDEEDLYADLDDEDEEAEDEDEEDEESDLFDEDEIDKFLKKTSKKENEEPKPEKKEENGNGQRVSAPLSQEKVVESIESVPLQLKVEMGRVRMTARELLDLSPGSLLELSIAPEQGVDITLNDRKIGRGELIKMGEVLGVRILELGEKH